MIFPFLFALVSHLQMACGVWVVLLLFAILACAQQGTYEGNYALSFDGTDDVVSYVVFI